MALFYWKFFWKWPILDQKMDKIVMGTSKYTYNKFVFSWMYSIFLIFSEKVVSAYIALIFHIPTKSQKMPIFDIFGDNFVKIMAIILYKNHSQTTLWQNSLKYTFWYFTTKIGVKFWILRPKFCIFMQKSINYGDFTQFDEFYCIVAVILCYFGRLYTKFIVYQIHC